MAKNHGVTKRNRRSVSKTRSRDASRRIARTMATIKRLEKRDRALEQLHELVSSQADIRAAFLRREDISVLSPEEQERRFTEHMVRVEEFFTRIADMDPIFVTVNRMPEIMIEEGIDTTDIPEVTDWSGAVRGKFYRGIPVVGTPEAEAAEKEAEADIEAGRFKTYDSVEEFTQSLKERRSK